VDERTERSEFGYFGWAMGPGGESDRTVGTTVSKSRKPQEPNFKSQTKVGMSRV
jgi:hypothetical protein